MTGEREELEVDNEENEELQEFDFSKHNWYLVWGRKTLLMARNVASRWTHSNLYVSCLDDDRRALFETLSSEKWNLRNPQAEDIS